MHLLSDPSKCGTVECVVRLRAPATACWQASLVQRPSGVKIAWCKRWLSKRLLASGVNDFGLKLFPEKVVWRKKALVLRVSAVKSVVFESKCLNV